MNRIIPALLIVYLLICFPTDACTTFFLWQQGVGLFGRNYDWVTDVGLVVVNKKNVSKVSRAQAPNQPAKWKSRFGSVTFNQYGREFPNGGMNEAGLVVEMMWLDGTKYSEVDARPAVGGLEWIQYQLDMSASVSEMIRNANQIRIASSVPLHFLVADRHGKAATVEYLDGKLEIHEGDSLPVPALANSSYRDSLEYLKGKDMQSDSFSSLKRFAIASRMIDQFEQEPVQDPVAYAFKILEEVGQPSTQWTIVYDLKNSVIHFRTKQNSELKTIQFKNVSFDCGTQVMIADMNREHFQFSPYSRSSNFALIQSSYKKTDFLAGTPLNILQNTAEHPETFRCESNSKGK